MVSIMTSKLARALILAAFFCAAGAATSFAKPIRLKYGVIDPETSSGARAQAQLASPQSGLFLIQFTNAPTAEQRQELAAQGIELLKYVPEDAFIARFKNVSRSTPAVRSSSMAAPYLPQYKLDKALLAAAATNSNPKIRVAVLFAPGAPAVEAAPARRMFSRVFQQSATRLHTVVRGEIDPARLQALAQSPAVLWIEADRPMRLRDGASSKIVAGDSGGTQTLMQSMGYDGRSVAVSVADSGLNNGDAATMHPDLLGRTPKFFYYGALTDAADEHGHGTHVAGIVGGNGATGETDDNGDLYGLGVAPGASIIVQRIFDGAGNYEAPSSNEELTRDATEAGAVIGSNSWGDDTQGAYNLNAAEFDELVRDADASKAGDQPYILEFSAGNAGPGGQTLDSPAVGKNVIATGACQSSREDLYLYDTGPDTMADFSSRGPAEDGRIKPDLVAPGTWIASLQSESATDENAWAAIDSYYQYEGGTSQAGPHASGAAAVFVQFYRAAHANATPSPALVKAALINAATPMDPDVEVGSAPNMDEGWGRLDLTAFVSASRRFDYLDQTVLLTNSQVYERRIIVASAAEPLKVTLAYTDVPGTPAVLPALVNNLDLEVVGPDGALYRGNQFEDGESIPNATVTDAINNVEGVYLGAPIPGEYVVRVRATHVVEDARVDTTAIDQDFALVTSADIPNPGEAVLVLDRARYTAPSVVKIRLFDSDLAGKASAQVTVRSSTEPAGELITLAAATATGSFTGAVFTVTGKAAADGKLEIANGDQISATYYDASFSSNRVVYATADLVPPVLTAVGAANEFGTEAISWTSDEAASSIVYYGTNTPPKLVVSNLDLVTSHDMTLSGLANGKTYYYYVVSADEAGNFSTNNNGGNYYSFVATNAPPVLLLDAGVDTSDFSFGMPSLSGYTAPLNQLGVVYDTWVTDQRGIPSLATLTNYPAIICRLPEVGTALTSQQLVNLGAALSSYVNQGGSLFVATMDGLSRMEEAGASSFVTQTLRVAAHDVDAGVEEIAGTGDSVGLGMNTALDYSAYETVWADWIDYGLMDTADISDTITPDSSAESVLEDGYGNSCALRWPKPGVSAAGRVVVCSFPLDAIPSSSAGANNRAAFLREALQFLIPGLNGLATVEFDQPSYTVPSRVVFEVDDSDLAGLTSATATAYSSRQTNGIAITLSPLNANGAFSGAFNLAAPGAAPASGQLTGANGDTLRVDYYDATSKAVVSATATIDTQGPVITGVVASPDYQSVTVSWTTSEPANSSVNMGTSVLFDHAASDSILTTTHEVTVSSLAPDTAYLFQVSSRDAAGNTVIDDNNGNYYTVHTLVPLALPFTDNFDGADKGWTTYDGDGSETSWTLGVPNNSLATAAHSAPDAWGSSLSGASLSQADIYLISPAFYIPTGAQTTLSFWHLYDFTSKSDMDITEGGIVQVVTNSNAGSPISLASYSDDAVYDWEEEKLDLTPYAGQVVYLAWEYQLFSFDTLSRPGWIVDDVSIAISNTPIPAILTVTNNLWQAAWTLAGPQTTNTGAGLSASITNAAAGTYIIAWAPVQDFTTPAPQTNTLAAGSSLLFTGNYTMVDTNGNGIPDSWERRYFGAVAANHPATTDSDGDGVSDYAEFIAGTNPTNAASVFKTTAVAPPSPDGRVTLQWVCGANRACRVLGSADAVSWAPVTGWLYNTNSYTLPAVTNGAPYLFRIEIKP